MYNLVWTAPVVHATFKCGFRVPSTDLVPEIVFHVIHSRSYHMSLFIPVCNKLWDSLLQVQQEEAQPDPGPAL